MGQILHAYITKRPTFTNILVSLFITSVAKVNDNTLASILLDSDIKVAQLVPRNSCLLPGSFQTIHLIGHGKYRFLYVSVISGMRAVQQLSSLPKEAFPSSPTKVEARLQQTF